MIQDINDLDVYDKTVLFIMGAMDELTKLGYLRQHGDSVMTPKGIGTWDQLVAEGFVPDRDHVLECVETLEICNDPELMSNVIMEFAFKLLPEQQEARE